MAFSVQGIVMIDLKGYLQRIFCLLIGAVILAGSSPSAEAQIVIKRGAKGPFPVQIAKPGSYILGGNLDVPTSGTNAIDVNTSNVTIDLNGFVISGPGSGIGISASGVAGTTVRNGVVIGFSTGLALGDGSVVQNVQANANQGDGIECGGDCQIFHDGANSNGNNGILVSGSNNLISDSTTKATKARGSI
jgi:hypothetical protein